MDHTEGRPIKRLKTDSKSPIEKGKKSDAIDSPIDFAETQTNVKPSSKSKFKTKKTAGLSIINTIDHGENQLKKRKAISGAELDLLKEKSKKSETTKNLTSIIDIKEESDISIPGGSSPFKIIRSSQDFNLESPAGKLLIKQESTVTPTLLKTRPSSDDGIFWITTPQSDKSQRGGIKINKKELNESTNAEKLPSSPLKHSKDSQAKDLSDSLLDPELKKLIARYEITDGNELNKKPLFSRASSDSRALSVSAKEPKKIIHKNATQVVATKSTLKESIFDQMNKQNNNNNNDRLDLSDMLLQIGSKLLTSVLPNNDKNENVMIETLETSVLSKAEGQNNKINHDDDSDVFSDEIDMSEIVANAIQPSSKRARDLVLLDSEDSFSDDDDDIMEKIELGLTQQQFRHGRPNTDQTDIGDELDADTKKVTKDINSIDLNDKNRSSNGSGSKYKGMVKIESFNENDNDVKESKQFKLFDEGQNLAKSAIKHKSLERLQIKDIREGIFKRNAISYKQYILTCLTAEEQLVNIMVRDHWSSLDFKVNDIIHIIISKEGGNFQLVDKDHNLLIWNPDTLISATRIADAIDCKRKSIINQKFNGPGIVSVPFIIGNITHCLFQQCLLHKRVDDEFSDAIIEQQLDSHILEIYAANKNKQEIKSIIREHFLYIQEWIKEYVSIDQNTENKNHEYLKEYKVSNILSIEENIMSPIFGIRGLIDVVIEAELQNGNKFVVPLEIKTGREYISNTAQVSLYTLLVKQKYEVESFYTSLVYTKLHQCYLNAIQDRDLRLLINIRNELSQFLVYGVTELPPLIKRTSCERCFSLHPCMTLNKLTENGTAVDSGIDAETYDEITGHLNNNKYKEFYRHWDSLITKEEGLMNFARTDLWKNSAEQRESNGGNCIGNLKVVNCDFSSIGNQFVYMFERDSTIYPPLTSSQLAKNDRIILSDDSTFGLTMGYIKLLRPDIVVIITDTNWSDSAVRLPGFEAKTNQTFRSVLSTKTREKNIITLDESVKLKTFRIDKDQITIGMSMARFNLLNLFLPGGDSKNRRLIVELKKPEFSSTPQFKYDIKELVLNEDQLKAVDAASKINDYCLILGMPGTGKTTVISSIIDCIVKSGKTVLISSYTHSAVDNICEKIIQNAKKKGETLSLLRVGTPSKINEIVHPYSFYSEKFTEDIKNKKNFETIVDDCQIVAATCLGISDIIFGMGKRFDYCIVDEASQVPLPVVLGPISFSDRFILVGDHYQLAPLVLHPEAKRDGLNKSLFQILSDTHPSSVVELTQQYRMCSDIMSLSNELIYDGRLKCGSEKVANQMLKIPYFNSLPIDGTCIQEILDPERRVVFVNEDNIDTIGEISIGDRIENPGEAKFITTLIKVMLLGGIKEEDIGVMSFYKAQLRHFFVSLMKYKDIEILTADRFQGRDKDVIIISLVRTEFVGDLLKEWRRVNVAITRARCKLIIFGSKKLLESAELFEGFIDMIKANNWCYDLKEGDEEIASNMNFLEHDALHTQPSTQTQVSNEKSSGFVDSQLDVSRLDSKSRVIRHSKILKYVMDDLTK
jgi:DNA replication ATP-dependent helicase Dna2